MRLKKGMVAHPGSHRPLEVVLVRPPLYLTTEEFDLLCAKAITAGLAPPDFLDRGRRRHVRQSVVAELCRRAVLASLLGIRRFKDPAKTRLGTNHPMRAYAKQQAIGGRFECLACRSARRRSRRRGPEVRTARRLRDEAVEKARSYRAQNAALRERLRAALALIEELQDSPADSHRPRNNTGYEPRVTAVLPVPAGGGATRVRGRNKSGTGPDPDVTSAPRRGDSKKGRAA